jgi:peroxin-4
MYRTRILKEANEAAKMRDPNLILVFDDKDLFNWTAFLFGPDDSPYSDGIFELKINLTNNYPLNAPKIFFKTRIFHPNILWDNGEVW